MKQISIAAFIIAISATMAGAATLNPVETEARVLIGAPPGQVPVPVVSAPETAVSTYTQIDSDLKGRAIQHSDGTASIDYKASLASGDKPVTTYMETKIKYDFVTDGLFDALFSHSFDYNVTNTSIYIEGYDVKVDLSYLIFVDGAKVFDAYYSVETYFINNVGQGLRITNQDDMSGTVTPIVNYGWVFGHDITLTDLVGSVALPYLGYDKSSKIEVRMGAFVDQPQTEAYVEVKMGDPNGIAPSLGVSDPISAVPLPAGAWLLLGGLGALGLVRRRRS